MGRRKLRPIIVFVQSLLYNEQIKKCINFFYKKEKYTYLCCKQRRLSALVV